jgi:hypothetical protein
MKKKHTIKVDIRLMFKMVDRYKVVITYDQGGAIFTDDKDGKGYMLHEAQHLLIVMHDHIKSDE